MEFDEFIPAVWHAFTALNEHQTGNGLKSQLKVLAFAIAQCMDVDIDKEALEKYKEKDTVSFEDFLDFLKEEVLNKRTDNGDHNANRVDLKPDKICDACWLVCQKYYAQSSPKRLLTKDDIQKCWRVFNFLSEVASDDNYITPIVLHRDEAELVISKIMSYVSKRYEREMFEEQIGSDIRISFEKFLTLVESMCFKGLDYEAVSATVDDVYSEFILQVLKKGHLDKKAPSSSFRSYSKRYFLLTPEHLQYYTDADQRELKGKIDINQHCRAGMVTSQEKGKAYRFSFVTEGRTFELNAPDARTRTTWLELLNMAIESSKSPYGPQKMALLKRRNERKAVEERRKREEEARAEHAEKLRQQQMELEAAHKAKADLETSMQEELAKKDAIIARLKEIEEERKRLEVRLSQEATQRDSYLKQLKALEQEREELKEALDKESEEKKVEIAKKEEMERIREELERRLVEEEQARRDEEIVRNQAALALKEELEKREELEKLKVEHMRQLEEEKVKRQDLETLRTEQQDLLEEKRLALQQLQLDRQEKDRELQEALEKIDKAEQAKQEIAKKVKATQNPEFQKLLTERICQEFEKGTPEINSHRGKGAFTPGEFDKEKIEELKKQLSFDQHGIVDGEIESESGESPFNQQENETETGESPQNRC